MNDTNDKDDTLDERDLYAEDGGGEPDAEYPFLTEYQVQRFQELITDAEFAYEEHPLDENPLADHADVQAAEKKIFAYVGLLLAKRDAHIKAQAKRIAYLESHVGILAAMFNEPVAREGRYEGVKVLVITSRPVTTDPLVYRAQYAEGPQTGLNLQLAHDDIAFIDPVRVVTESFVHGLLERVGHLEAANEAAVAHIETLENFVEAVREVNVDVDNALMPETTALEHTMIEGLLRAIGRI